MKKVCLFLIVLLIPFALATTESGGDISGGSAEESLASGTIYDTLLADPEFSTLLSAIDVAGLGETLAGAGPYTIFAPTNAAFDALDPADLEALLADPTALSELLLGHVVSGEITSDQASSGEVLTSEQGTTIDLATLGASITYPDITASNGLIQGIDTVLVGGGSSDSTASGGSNDGSTDDGTTDDGTTDDSAQ